ncbi:TRAP transporter small permease [Hoeflea prorocentri]|uniref:TRAP transporter small permease protein n=1 Tax=Hoeflea prorocentri TaxID=1922333 RepID=A0A9X3UDJ1_9HYPH|nr:TRAP transporter small permease subunit [Hoeflea prorocentri]MCY6379427.1 TRAP transporter small permease subunit [Hoeflea prorocentri]MDA5397228.1 TRAP transporter small permease subunit [Hoeflea prorocentri]
MMRLFSLSARIPGLLASLALFVLMVLTFTDVVLRSVLNAPIEIASDLTRLLMAIMVFSVLPVVSARSAHISVDLLDVLFYRLNLARWRDAAVDLFCGVILIWPARRVFDLAERSRSYGDTMEYLGAPLFYVGWFIALMTAITALVLIIRGLLLIFMPRLVEEAI